MDTITIEMEDGTKKEMEMVSLFDMSSSDFHYIIYKSDNDYYVGKYTEADPNTIITELSNEELTYCESVLKRLIGE